MMSDAADLQARALALLREAPFYNADWEDEKYWQERWDAATSFEPIWAVHDSDKAAWLAFNPVYADTNNYRIKKLPFVDNYPDFFTGSWETTATVEAPDETLIGPSQEWIAMLAVRSAALIVRFKRGDCHARSALCGSHCVPVQAGCSAIRCRLDALTLDHSHIESYGSICTSAYFHIMGTLGLGVHLGLQGAAK